LRSWVREIGTGRGGELKSPFSRFGADLVAAKHLLFRKRKMEGKALLPCHLSFLSVLLSPLSPQTAVKMAVKAAIYSVEASLYYLKKSVGRGMEAALRGLEEEIGRNRWVDVLHVRRLYERYSGRLEDRRSRREALGISLKNRPPGGDVERMGGTPQREGEGQGAGGRGGDISAKRYIDVDRIRIGPIETPGREL
jgi:hypothetical protein